MATVINNYNITRVCICSMGVYINKCLTHGTYKRAIEWQIYELKKFLTCVWLMDSIESMLLFVDRVRFGGGRWRCVVVTYCRWTIIFYSAVYGGCQIFVKRISVIRVCKINTIISFFIIYTTIICVVCNQCDCTCVDDGRICK